MSRPQRILYENAYYHVMNRGAGHQKIFNDRAEREIFFKTLEEAYHQFCIEVQAYCLMDNHYHLLIKTPKANLSRAMRHINGVYTQRYNQLNKTDGSLFRGRYKAILIDSDAYLLHLSKYIHLNPISAGMIDDLEEYEWSSYSAYIGKVETPTWLVQDDVYAQLNGVDDKAKQYQIFMTNENLDKKLTKFYNEQSTLPILGNDLFINSLKVLKPSTEVPRHSRAYTRPSIERVILEVAMLFNEEVKTLTAVKKGRTQTNVPRKMAMYVARKYGDYRFQELADAFGLRHYGSAAYAVYAFEQELKGERELEILVNRVIKQLDSPMLCDQ